MNDQKQKIRLQGLIDTMKSGKDVANRDMKSCLTVEEWEEYENQLESYKNYIDAMTRTPEPLKKYVEQLKIADLLSARAETMSMKRKGKPASQKSLYYKAEAAYEHALETLSEIVEKHSNCTGFLDRPFYYSTANPSKCCSPDPDAVPRLRNSLSHHANKTKHDSLHEYKRSCKLSALENSLDILVNGKPEEPAPFTRPTFNAKTYPRKILNFD